MLGKFSLLISVISTHLLLASSPKSKFIDSVCRMYCEPLSDNRRIEEILILEVKEIIVHAITGNNDAEVSAAIT